MDPVLAPNLDPLGPIPCLESILSWRMVNDCFGGPFSLESRL
jgi:hypothetical protein